MVRRPAAVLTSPVAALAAYAAALVYFALADSLPALGTTDATAIASKLGVADVVFLGFYASAAWRHGLRRTATAIGLLLGLVAAVVAGVLTDRTLPVLPALALGLLLPNLDRLGPLLSTDDGG